MKLCLRNRILVDYIDRGMLSNAFILLRTSFSVEKRILSYYLNVGSFVSDLVIFAMNVCYVGILFVTKASFCAEFSTSIFSCKPIVLNIIRLNYHNLELE